MKDIQERKDFLIKNKDYFNNTDLTYYNLLDDILTNGIQKDDRTNTGTISVFGRMISFDCREGFPILTTKKVHFKSIATELCWFLKGDTNTKYLKDNGCTIWNEWEDSNGELGDVYGKQWRRFGNEEFDQIQYVIDEIKKNPNSRRLLVNAWNPVDVANKKMALPPCHYGFQFIVEGEYLSILWNQR